MSKYYEESERYFREYEVKNGLGREIVDQERRTDGSPFRNDYDYNRQLNWPDSRARNGATYEPNRRAYPRQSSVPPAVRRLPYNYGSQSQAPPSVRHPPQSPYTGRYIPTTPQSNYYPSAPIEKLSETAQTKWPYYSDDKDRQFQPRSYYDQYEATRPTNKGPLLEGTQPLFPSTNYPKTQNIYPTSSPTQNQQQTPNFLQYASRPGSPQQIVGAGDILNSETGFTIQLDVKHFKAKDIKVTLVGHTLTVSGERVDEDPLTEQTLKRSFSRKYSIPTDILLDSIKAHLTDFGLLLIRGNRKNWRETEIHIEVITEEPPKEDETPKKVKDQTIAPAQHPSHQFNTDVQNPPLLADQEPIGQTTTPPIQQQQPSQLKEHSLKPRPELEHTRIDPLYIPPYQPSNTVARKHSRDSILKDTSASVQI